MRRRRSSWTRLLAILLGLLLLGLAVGSLLLRLSRPQTTGTLAVAGLAAPVEVLRDADGVPHLFAQNERDLFLALGYVHAQDRLWQMEFRRRLAAGRLAELFGPSAVEADQFLRTLGLYRAAERDVAALDADSRAALDAYAAGVNAFLDTHHGFRLPFEFGLLRVKPEPWQPADSLAWLKVVALSLCVNYQTELFHAKAVGRLGPDRAVELLSLSHSPTLPLRSAPTLPRPHASTLWYASMGSNSWVLAGTHTASGKPLLANDPHLDLQMPSVWYQVHLVGGDYDVVGMSMAGLPGVLIGHNAHLAWGLTNAPVDVQDLYVERLHPQDPHRYKYRGQWREMAVRREEIPVRGQKEPVVLEVQATHHGPILTSGLQGIQETVALRWTVLEKGGELPALLGLNRARNWAEFTAALRSFVGPPQNVVYADVEGHIGCVLAGLIPVRPKGSGIGPMPGWTGEHEWSGYVPFEKLPRLFDPPSGMIVTANHKLSGYEEVAPLLAKEGSGEVAPLLAKEGSGEVAPLPGEWSMPYRARRIEQQLASREKWTVADLQALQTDVYSVLAEDLRPYLLKVQPRNELEEAALRAVRDWDLRFTTDSVAATVFAAWYARLFKETFRDELGDSLLSEYLNLHDQPIHGLAALLKDPAASWFDDARTEDREGREEIVARSFRQAIEGLSLEWGPDLRRWNWGRVHVAAFIHQPLGQVRGLGRALNRAVPGAGSLDTVNVGSWSLERPFMQTTYASARLLVDLSDFERSVAIHAPGQSGQFNAPHYADLLPPWSEGQYRPLRFDWAGLEARGAERLVLQPAERGN